MLPGGFRDDELPDKEVLADKDKDLQSGFHFP